MEIIHLKIIESVVAAVVYLLLRFGIIHYIDNTISKSLMQKTRGKVVKKTIKIILLLLFSTFVLIVWGVDQSELAMFIGSVLTVIGIALFAQWSILSNITSGIILFFNHSVNLDDTIIIMDKDYAIEGRVSDIGLFFVILKTTEGEEITIPSNVFMQKTIKKMPVRKSN
jgi:small-conductance mechanosensitive channel